MQEAETIADQLLAYPAQGSSLKAQTVARQTQEIGFIWEGGWDMLPVRSLNKALAALPRENKYSRSILQGLLGIAMAREGNWQAGFDVISSAGFEAEKCSEIWSAKIQLAALLHDRKMVESLAIGGIAQFGSDADALSASGLTLPLLAVHSDLPMTPSLEKLVSKSLSGNVDTAVYAKLPLAMLCLRSGELARAIQVLDELSDLGPAICGKYYFDPITPQIFFLRSAILAKRGNRNGALDAYHEGFRRHSSSLREPGKPYQGAHWIQSVTAELLRREAASILGEDTQ